jgi:two-component system, sensor histidine kinase and response regulator
MRTDISNEADKSHSKTEANQSTEVFHLTSALNRIGNDQELFKILVNIYLEDSPKLMEKLHLGFQNNDFEGIHHAAHALRGLVSNFDATKVIECARTVEQESTNHALTLDHAQELQTAASEFTTAINDYK